MTREEQLAKVKRPGSRTWPLLKRLLYWSKLDPKTKCRVWTGSRYPFGHGQIRWKGRLERAHRMMWTVKRGPIPPGKHVLHKCNNPPCIEDTHLYLGDDADNTADKIRAGTLRIGQDHGMAKLLDKQVRHIKQRVISVAAYAALYNISRSYVYSLWRGERWKHLTTGEKE